MPFLTQYICLQTVSDYIFHTNYRGLGQDIGGSALGGWGCGVILCSLWQITSWDDTWCMGFFFFMAFLSVNRITCFTHLSRHITFTFNFTLLGDNWRHSWARWAQIMYSTVHVTKKRSGRYNVDIFEHLYICCWSQIYIKQQTEIDR